MFNYFIIQFKTKTFQLHYESTKNAIFHSTSNTGEAEKDTGGKQGSQDGGKLKEEKFHWNIKKNPQRPFKIKEEADLISKSKEKKTNPEYIKITWNEQK